MFYNIVFKHCFITLFLSINRLLWYFVFNNIDIDMRKVIRGNIVHFKDNVVTTIDISSIRINLEVLPKYNSTVFYDTNVRVLDKIFGDKLKYNTAKHYYVPYLLTYVEIYKGIIIFVGNGYKNSSKMFIREVKEIRSAYYEKDKSK